MLGVCMALATGVSRGLGPWVHASERGGVALGVEVSRCASAKRPELMATVRLRRGWLGGGVLGLGGAMDGRGGAREGRARCCGAVSSLGAGGCTRRVPRSEEHTSELQSRGHLVCRLLLEIKKLNQLNSDIRREH